jgi:outer membrane receptor protein involved in Fe transport
MGVLLAGSVHAQQSNILSYPTAFFAEAHPNTAYDMLARLPGFTFVNVNSARGFAGSAGNVLIDGQRPTSKSDDLQSILQRIPATDVDHIDLIRGGAPGIDMQGQTVVANVVRRKEDSTQIVADLQDNIFVDDGHTVPNASLQYTRHSGDSTYEGSITRYGGYDDSVGQGTHRVTYFDKGTSIRQPAYDNGMGTGGALTGAATVPLFAGEFKANLALQDSPFHSAFFYLAPDRNGIVIKDVSGNRNGELGLHWKGDLGGVEVEALLLQRLSRLSDVNTLNTRLDPVTGAPDHERFTSSSDTGESIARETLRYSPDARLTFEGGGEAAYNFLDGTSAFIQDGVNQPLPVPNPHVFERRSELFGQETWKFADDWLLEAGARFEFSTIGETGEVNLSHSFFYPKPRAVLTWTPDADTQVRLRYEKVVGQLDFNNFIASSNLTGTGITAGNVNLRPDQHTQYEASYERHFLDKGAFVATFMHEQLVDTVDYVPVKGPDGTVFDAPGNIGNGTNDKLDFSLTLPLDWLGLKNGLFKSVNSLQWSHVPDPVTGVDRIISGQRPQDVELRITQDIESLNSTWSISYYNCWDEWYYRLAQVRHRRVVAPYFTAYWEYKPEPTLSLHLEVDDIGRFVYDDKYFNYPGPRGDNSFNSLEEISIRSQPHVYIQIRKTFG